MITKIRTSNGSVVLLLGGVHKFGIKDAFYRIGKQNGRYWVHRPFERSFYCSKSLSLVLLEEVYIATRICVLRRFAPF